MLTLSKLIAFTAGDPRKSAGSRFRVDNWIKNTSAKSLQRPKDPKKLVDILRRSCKIDYSKGIFSCLKNVGNASSGRPTVLLQKTPPLAHAEEIMKLKEYINIVFDICDPPASNYIVSAKEFEALSSFQMMCEIASVITVSSPQLLSSINRDIPVFYIPDCIDMPLESNVFGKDKKTLRLLWFGGSGNENKRTGIFEMIDCLDDLRVLCQCYPISLNVCSNLSPQQVHYVEKLVLETGITTFRNVPWSIETLQEELFRASYAWLPKTCGLATFYKSNNRVATAAAHGLRTITNRTLNDEVYDFNPIVVNKSDFHLKPACNNLLHETQMNSANFPSRWKIDSILAEWNRIITVASGQ